jgi:mycothiol synthase
VLTSTDGTLAGYAHLDAPDKEAQDGDASGELVIHPGWRRRGLGTALASALLAGASGHGVRLWAHGELPGAAGLARAADFTRFRALLRLRMPLAAIPDREPAVPDGVTLRTFRPGADEEAWLAVNHRAFAHHPEQGSWTLADLRLRESEAWFDPEGFFLAERDGQLAGFHWTKVHDGDGDGGPIGEVYVVGVDPGQQGGGLGRALTMAGLAHLRRTGLADVMLYVDESNTAAVKMYTALGFTLWSTDVMYRHQ